MLTIVVPASEGYDGKLNRFFEYPEIKLELEHSLLSISKWEAKWKKPFISATKKTSEEVIDYVRCMTINRNVPEDTYLRLTQSNFDDIQNYIDDPMTATTFSKEPRSGNHEIITTEIIYYWMTMLNVPFEPCEKWHLNRLLTLIRVINAKSAPPKYMSKNDIYKQNRQLNAARRAGKSHI